MMSGKGQEKQANKKKNKNSAKDQIAQGQPAQASRDSAPKPANVLRKPSEAPIKPAAALPAPAPRPNIEEPHVPMNGFNASEVEAMLSTGAADKGEDYKSDKPTLKAGGVWGAKPGAMANGKDFWLELRRQVAEVQANGSLSKVENKKQGG